MKTKKQKTTILFVNKNSRAIKPIQVSTTMPVKVSPFRLPVRASRSPPLVVKIACFISGQKCYQNCLVCRLRFCAGVVRPAPGKYAACAGDHYRSRYIGQYTPAHQSRGIVNAVVGISTANCIGEVVAKGAVDAFFLYFVVVKAGLQQ